MKPIRMSVALALLMASPAAAEVRASDDDGFAVAMTMTVAAAPGEVWTALGQIGDWWSREHGYTGDAANMTIDLRAGGCFCETVPKVKGSVEHARVVLALPPALLRLHGGIGPLQSMAVSAVMDWTLKPSAGGTEVGLTYVVAGAIPGGGKALAPAVDQVLGEQFHRLKLYAEKRE